MKGSDKMWKVREDVVDPDRIWRVLIRCGCFCKDIEGSDRMWRVREDVEGSDRMWRVLVRCGGF